MEFTKDWTNNLAASLKLLFPSSVENKLLCVEIGCFEGKGSLHITAILCGHEESRLYCIDPWDDVYVKSDERFNSPRINDMCIGQYSRFINNTQSEPKIIAMRGSSDSRIPELPASLDFAYIDGDHSPEQVYKDACNVFPKIRSTGIILFDDYLFSHNDVTTGIGIDKFIEEYADQVEIILKGYQLAVRKN